MMPGSFLVLNIWVGSLFSVRVSAASQIYFKCKSNNTNELGVEHFPSPSPFLLWRSRALCQWAGLVLRVQGCLDSQEATSSRRKHKSSAAYVANSDNLENRPLPFLLFAAASGWPTWVKTWDKIRGWLSQPVRMVDGRWCMKRKRCALGAAWKSDLESLLLSYRLLTSAFYI